MATPFSAQQAAQVEAPRVPWPTASQAPAPVATQSPAPYAPSAVTSQQLDITNVVTQIMPIFILGMLMRKRKTQSILPDHGPQVEQPGHSPARPEAQ